MNLFQSALARQNASRPPIWLMRQAGRYHSHYQELKRRYTFMELCKNPSAALETTMGPIRDFDFDAAILFSDLLFPLEVMGTGLRYDPGPKLDRHLRETADLAKLRGGAELAGELEFQAQALRLIRAELDPAKGLLGFVGGPFTLYCYAVEGSHAGELASAKAGLRDGRWAGFCEKLLDLLAENMAMQARAGADTVAVLDTCAGELSPQEYAREVVPVLRALTDRYAAKRTGVPLSYYSKGTGPSHWAALEGLPFACLGVDWNHDLSQVLREWSARYGIQGNIDPEWMLLPGDELERRLRGVWDKVRELPPSARAGWVCGLGHGVLQKTPEENVRRFVRLSREVFSA